MGSGIVYDILGMLVLLLVLASQLDRNRHRSRVLLLIALGLFVGGAISWCLEALHL
jgi:hypothetical protein